MASNSSFLLDSFRPWNPNQDKQQRSPETSAICRYPSPISITTAPPSSIVSRDIVSKAPKGNTDKAQRHPLPARPPVEVCLNSESQSGPQATGPELEDSPQNVTIEQNPQASYTEVPVQARGIRDTINIDPAILHDNSRAGSENVVETEIYQGIASTNTCPSPASPFANTNPLPRSNRHVDTVTSSRQIPKVTKRSYTRRKGTGRGPGRPSKSTSHHTSPCFSSVRSQFSAMPVEDRLQFLSWLFEGALSHCVSTLTSAGTAVASKSCPPLDANMLHDCAHWDSNTEPADAQNVPFHHVTMLEQHSRRPSCEEVIPEAIELEDELEYEIERILKHRKGARGSVSYLVKWKGYEDVEATWEPHASVQDTAALDDYELQLATTAKRAST